MNQDITQKTYKKLCFEVSYSDLSFCIIDLISNKIVTYKSYSINKNNVLEEELWKIFVENPILDDKYDDVVVLHNSNLNTLVPSSWALANAPKPASQICCAESFMRWLICWGSNSGGLLAMRVLDALEDKDSLLSGFHCAADASEFVCHLASIQAGFPEGKQVGLGAADIGAGEHHQRTDRGTLSGLHSRFGTHIDHRQT